MKWLAQSESFFSWKRERYKKKYYGFRAVEKKSHILHQTLLAYLHVTIDFVIVRKLFTYYDFLELRQSLVAKVDGKDQTL